MKYWFSLPASPTSRRSIGFELGLFIILSLLCPMRLLALTPASTTTVLEISPGDSVAPGALVTLKASVSSGGNPVSPGLVLFCDAAASYCTDIKVFGQAQLTSSGAATLHLILPIGVHQIKAVFPGTKLAAGSASTSQTLTVTTQRYPTATTISASGTPGDYSLTGTVTSIGSSLSGTLEFPDATNGGVSLAEAPLGLAAIDFVPVPPTFPSGNGLGVVADFNGDGHLDQAVLSSNGVSIFLGNGDGTFTLKSTITLGSQPYSLAVGDFNGDDHPDLAVADVADSTVIVLLGNGDGSFTSETPIPTVQYPELVAVADFDGDGNADIVAAAAFGGLQVMLGKGDGTFALMPSTPQGSSYPSQSVVGDFNSDGKTDLVMSFYGGNVLLFLSNGDGTFQQSPIDTVCDDACPGVAGADFNGDGKLDLAVTDRGELDNLEGYLYVLLGNGDATFTQEAKIPGGYPEPLGIGDFNGDGNADIVFGQNSYPGVTIVLGPGFAQDDNGNGLIGVSGTANTFLPGDFNNDGKTDLILGDPNSVSLSEVQATATVSGISITSGAPGFHQVFARYEGSSTERPSSSGTVPLPGPGATTVIPPPVFSPPAGAYPTAQAVYITDAAPGAKIYYTTDGSTPTMSSTPYVGPISVTSTSSETISALAVVENYWPSPAASATYTDPNAFTLNFNNPNDFPWPVHTNGSADTFFLGPLSLTVPINNEAGSVFFTSAVNVQSFTTDFTFQLLDPAADGFTFTIQNAGLTALGADGGSLGYAGIGQSVAIKFDLFQNHGDPSNNSTGIFIEGALPIGPTSIDLTGTGINLHSGDEMGAYITYDGTTLNLTIADLTTLAFWSHAFVINIPATVGGDTAYVGFTGATGAETSFQDILTWNYQAGQPLYYPGLYPWRGVATNGSASLSGTSLQLTTRESGEAGSAFYPTAVNIQSFTTNFDFKLTDPVADGFTFTIQNAGPTALGGLGGSLGYAGIGNSVAIKFDLFQNAGDPSNNSTGLFVDGTVPVGPTSIDLTGSGINLHSGDKMDANLTYNGTTLTLTITDLVTSATWSHPFTINIPATVGGNSAYVGFTAATGGESATQQILSWTFE